MARLTFQDLILRLQSFWADRGCMIEMPLDVEVGAGTMHPATFLRVLGPEPWNVAYVQPSRRPADGRYGENPFRLGKHYQFQVILKPSPLDVQELYLDSLRALGLDLTRHDIRFEEDNWEAPTLGAWGVGWQILLDGMEISQFTYFQQAGGIDLAPISAEITYGLERLTMFLSRKSSVFDIEWGAGFGYGPVRKQDEYEFSKYYFEVADIDTHWTLLDIYDAASLAGSSGKPSSRRDSRYWLAQRTARSRTRLITATRSVTDTAPRASSTLKMLEHFSVNS